MRLGTVSCTTLSGTHRIAYTDWGALDSPRVLICAHGLTRCGRDFDALAGALQDEFRVVCPDAVGRGQSDWLTNPDEYSYTTYVADMQALIAHLALEPTQSLYWVGTSMGGLTGMLLAAQPNSPIKRLVLNDVGSRLPRAALSRIGTYVGVVRYYDTFGAIVDAVRAVSPFGPLSHDQWRELTQPLVKQDEQGRWLFRYDPAIGNAFKDVRDADVDLTAVWNAVTAPTLILRGESSDLLSEENFAEMCAKPGVQGKVIANTGHAPMLQDAATIETIGAFLVG